MKTPAIVVITAVSTLLILFLVEFAFSEPGCGDDWGYESEPSSTTLGKELLDLWQAKEEGAISEEEYTQVKRAFLSEILHTEEIE